MGYATGDAATDLDKLSTICTSSKLKNVHEFNFYQLVELIHKLEGISAENDDWERQCKLVFSGNPSLGFSASDVAKLEKASSDCLALMTNFFGLSGGVSPLPSYMVEQLLYEEKEGLKKPFFDFFNNRIISLSYRIWRKYRYHIRFESGANDQLSSQIFALVGLSDTSLRKDTSINWSKMLSYAGLLAGRSRSPQIVEGIISHCFDLNDVFIRQLIKRSVPISHEQRQVLGLRNMVLGMDTVLGSHIEDSNGKFVVCLNELTQQQFESFLPSGENFQRLRSLIEFVIREQLAYDIELAVSDNKLNFKENNLMALGWTSFLGQKRTGQSVLIQGRQ